MTQGQMHDQVLVRVGVGTAGKLHLLQRFFLFQLQVGKKYSPFPSTLVL